MNTDPRFNNRNGRRFLKERDAMLRLLDNDAFDKHCRKWRIKTPSDGWVPLAREALMHKSRIEIDTFTPEEKAVSFEWLAEHGMTSSLNTMHMQIGNERWFKLPLKLRVRYWKETNYGAKPVSTELATEIYQALGEVCEACGKNAADPPSKLCPGCEAYKDHTGEI